LALRDLSTFLSRYFVIGFYLPAFFGLIALGLELRPDWVADHFALRENTGALVDKSLGDHVLKIGFVALPIGLVLSGIWLRTFVFFQNLPFFGLDAQPIAARYPRLQNALLFGQRHYWDKLFARSLDPDPYVKNAAALRLVERFPNVRERVQPGRFGNAVRAYEEYAAKRWGMDFATVWPRIETLLGEGERAIHDDARTALAFAVNVSFALFAIGLARLIGLIWPFGHDSSGPYDWGSLWTLVPFLISYLVYRLLGVAALIDLGARIRASLDLHRLELYRKLAVNERSTFSAAERDGALALSAYLLYGPTEDSAPISRQTWGRAEGSN
jgi:hypothetical protein